MKKQTDKTRQMISALLLPQYGINFKAIREAHQMTQKDIEKNIGISYAVVSAIEKGKREPTAEQILLYSNYFGVSIDYLLGHTTFFELDNKIIGEKTGLTEPALDSITQLHSSDNASMFVLNQLLEKGAIGDICKTIAVYYNQIEQAENAIEELNWQIERAENELSKLEQVMIDDEPTDNAIVQNKQSAIYDLSFIHDTLKIMKAQRENTAQKYITYELFDRLKEEIDKIISDIVM